MAKVDNDETLEDSNAGEQDDQLAEGEETQEDDDSQNGNANDDDDSTDENDDDGKKKPTRGERRHERYIDKLSAEIRDSNARDTRSTDELFQPKPHEPLDFKEGGEYDPKDLEADRKAVAENKFAEGVRTGLHQGSSQMEKELWIDRFDVDTDRVVQKYPELETNDKLEKNLVQSYISFVGLTKDAKGRISVERPNVRFKDFVEARMKELDDYASARGAKTQVNVARQRAQTSIRPAGQGTKPKGGHGFDPNDPAGSVKRMTSEQYFKLGGKEASDAYLAKRGLA